MKNILVITTGGTIDAEVYGDEAPEFITPLPASKVPETIKELGYGEECEFFEFCRKDSKDFTPEDFAALGELIRKTNHKHIIVTSGTDKMPADSRRMEKLLAGMEKTVVFTGAMTPLAQDREPGRINLETVFNGLAGKPPGVFVVMNGQWFLPLGLRKNFATREFYITEHLSRAERVSQSRNIKADPET